LAAQGPHLILQSLEIVDFALHSGQNIVSVSTDEFGDLGNRLTVTL
jgi:hypothetical protein